MSAKSDRAVQRLTAFISEATAPDEMSKEEALDVLERIRDDVEIQAEALSEEIERG